MTDGELSPLKGVYFAVLAVTILSLYLLMITPNQTGQFLASFGGFEVKLSLGFGYLLFFLMGAAMLVMDWLLKGEEWFDTISLEEEDDRFLLQKLGASGGQALLVSLGAGLLLGLWYARGVIFEQKAFMFVPQFFSALPISPLTSLVSPRLYDAGLSSLAVASIEELIFVGVLFSLLWLWLEKPVAQLVGGEAAHWGVMVVAAVVAGWVASFVFHTFLPSYTAYAFIDAWRHFALTAVMAGCTGTILGGVLAHAIHNFVAKVFLQTGSYQALGSLFQSLPEGMSADQTLQALQALNASQILSG